jgi:DNA-binding transcriptional LysR family regulator
VSDGEGRPIASDVSVEIVALPRFYLAGDLASGNLVELLSGFPLAPLGIFAVHAKSKVVPAKVRRFIDHLARRLRAQKLD